MLTISGSEIRPAHRGELRVLVAARRMGLGQVRAYLAADILRRLSERSGLAPTVVDLLPDQVNELRAVCDELNIHPPRHTLTGNDELAGLFADGVRTPVFDLGVRAAAGSPVGSFPGGSFPGGTDQAADEELAGHWIAVAGAADGTGGETGTTLRERLGVGEEPLAVRMMLMRHGYGEPLADGGNPRATDGAGATLARWRQLVAAWARSPSGPMSRRYADAIAGAFADGLDTAAALRELDALAGDPGEPDGVKFETFAAADMLFGLDLARDIGR